MKLIKPKFWEKKTSFLSIILYPLSLIFICLIQIKKRLVKVKNFNIPIICVGNIYIGGTGKTPLSIFLANEVYSNGKRPVIIRKFYKNHFDEHNFIKEYFKNLILEENRIDAILKAEKNGYDCAILDDGFQDYKINKDLNILCFNQNQLIGNGLVFPAGPLREKLVSINNAQIVVINGNKDEKFERKILKINKNLKVFYSKYLPVNAEEFKNKNLLAMAGIGNPSNFFQLIQQSGLKIQEKLIFPDHYEYSKSELIKLINYAKKNYLKILTTEKDFFRIKHYDLTEINFLKIKLEIQNKEQLISSILKIYDKND